MKTKQYFSLFVLLTAFFTSAFAQTGTYAMNMQAYENRKPTTIAEKNNLRDNGILPAATLNNPCASIAAVTAAAPQVGSDLRMGEISRAEIVRTEGYAFSQTPVTWDNFGDVQAYLDSHTIIIPIDYGNQTGELSCTKWSNGAFQSTGWDNATVSGTYSSFAWDFRKESGNPLAVFPYELVNCNNLNGKSLLLSVFQHRSTIGQPSATTPSVNQNPLVPNLGPTNPTQQTYTIPSGAGTVINNYIYSAGGASTNTNTNTSPSGGTSSATPSITFAQAPPQMMPTSSTMQIAPGMAGYVNTNGNTMAQPGMTYSNGGQEQGNMYVSTVPLNRNGRPKSDPAGIATATFTGGIFATNVSREVRGWAQMLFGRNNGSMLANTGTGGGGTGGSFMANGDGQ